MTEAAPSFFASRHSLNGMVCSIDHLASAAGLSALRQGGSAADAAIATSAVLAVTCQHMCGVGGDLWAFREIGNMPDNILTELADILSDARDLATPPLQALLNAMATIPKKVGHRTLRLAPPGNGKSLFS